MDYSQIFRIYEVISLKLHDVDHITPEETTPSSTFLSVARDFGIA